MKKVRYAVVGTGYISQDAFMPSVDGTGNSCMTAIISGNPEGINATDEVTVLQSNREVFGGQGA